MVPLISMFTPSSQLQEVGSMLGFRQHAYSGSRFELAHDLSNFATADSLPQGLSLGGCSSQDLVDRGIS